MVWSEARDLAMLKEVAAEGVFVQRMGTRDWGTAWQNVAKLLNVVDGFNVTPRAIRDRYNLAKKLKAKLAREVRESGGGDDGMSEVEKLLEDLMEVSEESGRKCEDLSDAKKQAAENEKKLALEMRDRAMERFGETRKRLTEVQSEGKKGEEKEKIRGRYNGMAEREDWNGKENEAAGNWHQ